MLSPYIVFTKTKCPLKYLYCVSATRKGKRARTCQKDFSLSAPLIRLAVSDIFALTFSQLFREETTDELSNAFALGLRQEVQIYSVSELSSRTKCLLREPNQLRLLLINFFIPCGLSFYSYWAICIVTLELGCLVDPSCTVLVRFISIMQEKNH